MTLNNNFSQYRYHNFTIKEITTGNNTYKYEIIEEYGNKKKYYIRLTMSHKNISECYDFIDKQIKSTDHGISLKGVPASIYLYRDKK